MPITEESTPPPRPAPRDIAVLTNERTGATPRLQATSCSQLDEAPLDPLTLFGRAIALLFVEGASVGLGLWHLFAGALLIPYLTGNTLLFPEERHLVLGAMAAGGGLFALAGLGYLSLRGKRALGAIYTASLRMAPLLLSALLPLLFQWQLWVDRELTFLALASLTALCAQPLLYMSLTAPLALGPTAVYADARWTAPFRRLAASPFGRVLPLLLVAACAVWYASFFSYYTVLNHHALRTASFDLGIENNVVWNALHGEELLKVSPLRGPRGSHFGYHATFFSYVIALVYSVHQQPETLLVFQAVMIAAAAFPLFFYAKRHIGVWPASLLSCLYLLYAPVHGSNLYDFHYPPLGVFFVWTTLCFIDRGQYWRAAIAAALTLSVREDMSIGLLIVGAFLVLTNQRVRAGLVLGAVAAVYFVVLKLIVMPHALHGASSYTYIYKDLLPKGKDSFGAILQTVFGNPGYTLSTLLQREKLVYFLQIMTPLAFLPWRRAYGMLCMVPGLLFTLLSTGYKPVIEISFQYTAHWTTYLFIAMVAILAWLKRPRFVGDEAGPKRQAAWLGALTLAMLSTSYQDGALFQQHTARGGFGPYTFGRSAAEAKQYDALYSLIKKVPPRARIASTELIVPHVSSRPNSYTMRVGIFDAEYLLFPVDLRSDEWSELKNLLQDGTYGVIAQASPFVLAKLGAPPDMNKAVLKQIRH